VLALGFLLLDDKFLHRFLGNRFQPNSVEATNSDAPSNLREFTRKASAAVSTFLLLWLLYATAAQLIWMLWRGAPLPRAAVNVLEPFRIANSYGLFAVMTRARYEIEFQGSKDGQNWTAYPFRYKPQALDEAPKIYAPYQPRFDWNLWFASLGSWRENMFVVSTEERLLSNSPDVLSLLRANPFAITPPKYIRTALWQYSFTSMPEKRATGNWWKRESLGTYAPTLTKDENGKLAVVAWPTAIGSRELRVVPTSSVLAQMASPQPLCWRKPGSKFTSSRLNLNPEAPLVLCHSRCRVFCTILVRQSTPWRSHRHFSPRSHSTNTD